jgi:type I restriction enzyme S subunit
MSKIDELIAEFCPEGVPFVALPEVVEITRGLTYSKSDEDPQGPTRVLRSNNISKSSNTLDMAGLRRLKKDFIPNSKTRLHAGDVLMSAASGSRAHVGKVAYIDKDPEAYFGGFMTTFRASEKTLPRFVFHTLTSRAFREHLELTLSTSTINNINAAVLRGFSFQLPPLEVQREIVSILDKFTQLEAELEAELEARRSQYEHTRGQLLDFSGDLSSHPMREMIAEFCPEGVEHKNLGSLLRRHKGAPVTAASMKLLPAGDKKVRIFAGGKTISDVDATALDERFVASGPAIIVKSRGNIEFTYWENRFSHKNELWSYLPLSSELEIKFAYYFLSSKSDFFVQLAKSKSVKMPQISVGDTDEYVIPVPPLAVQREIVSILDKLDALVNDLSFGLPAEIAARRKQYEHYRNELLTFKELETA